jgi:hypothetical protein
VPSLNFRMFGLRSLAVVVVTAATLIASSGGAFAQGGGPGGRGGRGMWGGGGEGMLPPITSRQVDQYGKLVGFTPDQAEAASALVEGYAQEAAIAGKTMREAGEKMRESFRDGGMPDPAVFEKMQEAATKFRESRKQLDAALLNDMKSLLTPEQEVKWPSVERAHRRNSTLRWGRMSGERVDIADVVEKQAFADSVKQQVTPLLNQYEEEMDRELARRNEVYENAMEKMMELRRSGDMEAMQDMVEKGREAGKRVRDLNRSYFRQISDILPEDAKPAFEKAFRQESYPDIYRRGYSSRIVESASGMADLTTEQKEKIAEIAARYERETEPMNIKLAAAQEESEEKFNLQDMMARGWRQEGPVADLRRERRELDGKVIEEVKKILTEEQAARLPERSEDETEGDRRRGRQGEARRNQT